MKSKHQAGYEYLNEIHAHWDRRDADHINVWTSGYKTGEAYDIEGELRKHGFMLMRQDFDQGCGKTCNVFKERGKA